MKAFAAFSNRLPIAITAISLFVLFHFLLTDLETPSRDQLRYIDYAYNLTSHNVFGLGCGDYSKAPVPGNANAPLYPILLSATAKLDNSLHDTYSCALKRQGVRGDCVIGTNHLADQIDPSSLCKDQFTSVLFLHHILFAISLILLFLISRELFSMPALPWLTLLAALLSGIFTEYSARVLTENLLLTLFIGLQYACVRYCRQPGHFLAGVCGVIMALLTLTRPEYPYLVIAGIVSLLVVAIWRRELRYVTHALIFVVAFSLAMSPWLIRNKNHFNSWAVSAGNYGEITLAYRIAYNDMDLKHWLSSFVYFLPDFGDSLTRRVFPEAWYWREIDELNGSYQDLTNKMLTSVVRDGVTVADMIRDDVLGNFPKHIATTIPLSWRGVFIAKYWGLIAFFTYLVFQIKELRAGRYALAVVAAPTWILVGLHAGISINIPRYNLPLLTIYSLSLAWLSARCFTKSSHGAEN